MDQRTDRLKSSDLIVYVCGNSDEFEKIPAEKVDLKQEENIGLIKIGQNLFHDEEYQLKMCYSEKCCYVLFAKSLDMSSRKSIYKNVDRDEEVKLLNGSHNLTNKLLLLSQLENFLSMCLYNSNNVIREKSMLTRMFFRCIIFRRFNRLMTKNAYLSGPRNSIDKYNHQYALDGHFYYQ